MRLKGDFRFCVHHLVECYMFIYLAYFIVFWYDYI